MPHPDFNPPGKPPKLTGRRSTITGLFFTSLTPYVEPTEEEVDLALNILGMKRGECVCAYCGDKKSEWDHFRAVVKDRTPTGYITEIANLVPSCGKCNQSRGNKDWKAWMLGKARHSPTARGLSDIQARIQRLEAYEAWGKPVKIDYKALAGKEGWRQHLTHLEEVLALLEKAEAHASALRLKANAFARAPRSDV
jgi:5-methylcytosine-specific restriction endonuclease McrA